jgi:eukaryotic-like serine/threonine-protein kinase
MLEIVADDVLSPGQVIARRYRLDRIIGEGGMGIVWAATHVLTEKPCALKFLKASRAADLRSHARLLQEARAACRVRHPNVAQVHDILELDSGLPFIVMDLLEGESLAVHLARRGQLPLEEMVAILLPIVDAVDAAHEMAIVHRDLKPDNVFLERGRDGDHVVKVLDFGIAKQGDAPSEVADTRPPLAIRARTGLTTASSVIGTPSYMAPEQLIARGPIRAPADVWAIGILLFECLTGARPPRVEETHAIAADATRAILAERKRDLPPSLVDLVFAMLCEEEGGRPSLTRVRAVLSALEHERRTPSDLERWSSSSDRSARPDRERRRGVLGWALGGGGLVVLATAIVFVTARADTTKPLPSSPAMPTTPAPAEVSAPSVLPGAIVPSAPSALAPVDPPAVTAAASPAVHRRSPRPPPTGPASPPPSVASISSVPSAGPAAVVATAPSASASHGIPSYQRK